MTHAVVGREAIFARPCMHMGSDATVAEIGRESTDRAGTSDGFEAFIRAMITRGHWSPIEHLTVSFQGALPIFAHNQAVRHRALRWSVLSGRYARMQAVYVPAPDDVCAQDPKRRQCSGAPLSSAAATAAVRAERDVCDAAFLAYDTLLAAGVARERARDVLPLSTMTHFTVTANLRDWVFFLTARLPSDAQMEIRWFAEDVRKGLHELYPATMRCVETFLIGPAIVRVSNYRATMELTEAISGLRDAPPEAASALLRDAAKAIRDGMH